jgi:hypothetical protein
MPGRGAACMRTYKLSIVRDAMAHGPGPRPDVAAMLFARVPLLTAAAAAGLLCLAACTYGQTFTMSMTCTLHVLPATTTAASTPTHSCIRPHTAPGPGRTDCVGSPTTWQFQPVEDDTVCAPLPCTYRPAQDVTEQVTCEAGYTPPAGAYIVAATNWTDLATCTGTPGRARGAADGKCVVPERGSGSIYYKCSGRMILVTTCTDTACAKCSYASQSQVCAQSSGVSYYCIGHPSH